MQSIGARTDDQSICHSQLEMIKPFNRSVEKSKSRNRNYGIEIGTGHSHEFQQKEALKDREAHLIQWQMQHLFSLCYVGWYTSRNLARIGPIHTPSNDILLLLSFPKSKLNHCCFAKWMTHDDTQWSVRQLPHEASILRVQHLNTKQQTLHGR
jgi:hypothetical protein